MAESTRRHGIPKNFRVDDDLWEAFGQAAAKLDLDRATFLRQLIRWAVHHPEAMEPRRPTTPSWPPNE